MKPNPTPQPTFNRPLLDFTRVLRRHQFCAIDHQPIFEVLDKTVKALQAIQNAYELMPSSEPGKWFLRSGYEFAHRNIRERCASLKGDIDCIRPLLSQQRQDSNAKALDETLNQLTRFLGEAANDLSRLFTFVLITTPDEPSELPQLSLEDTFPSLEA